jgi:outer membrane receptor protein involved in Fe transport
VRVACCSLLVALACASARADDAPVYQSVVHARPRRENGSAQIVVTGRELAERGAQNLAEALALIPELQVRQGGMGIRLDLRGAKQFSILLLIDGVPLVEPYFGIFDVSAIPITDIVEIRVQLSPASPLEGPGGDGGIVEVFTLHATGARRIEGRVVGSSEPDAEGAVTARIPLTERSGMRVSAGASFADPGYPVLASDQSHHTFFDRQSQEYTGLRYERTTERGTFTADLWYGHRAFSIPPSDTTGAQLQVVTGEHAARAVVGGELFFGAWRLALGAYAETLVRSTDYYGDYTLGQKLSHQDLYTGRGGAAAHLDRTLARGDLRATLSARLSVDVEGAEIEQTGSRTAWGVSSYAELAVGGSVRWRWLRLDAAVGGLVPVGHAGNSWPEAKLTLGVVPRKEFSLLFIGARKGRLPTLRELYDPLQGNAALHPEQAWHGELRLEARPSAFVDAHLSGYLRRISGAIRLNPDPTVAPASRKDVNLDTIDVRGVEAGLDVARGRIFGGGVVYIFEDAYSASPALGFEAIPNFPTHRVDVYLASTWRRRIGGLVRFRYVSANFVQNVTLPPHELVDLSLWARLSKQFRATVRIDNLLDQRYQQLPGLLALPTTVTATVDGVWE